MAKEHELREIDIELHICLTCLDKGEVHVGFRDVKGEECPFCKGALTRIGHARALDGVYERLFVCTACNECYKVDKDGDFRHMGEAFTSWFLEALGRRGAGKGARRAGTKG